MKLKFASLLLALTVFASPAVQASTIEYIFQGTGTGTLGGDAFNGAFTIDMFGDTTTADVTPGFISNNTTSTFTSGALTANLSNSHILLATFNPSFPNIGFAQSQPAPVFAVNEALSNLSLLLYDLISAFPVTTGDLSVIDQTYLTDKGDLAFTGNTDHPAITALSFQAIIPDTAATPLPNALPMMMAALGGLGLFAFARRKTAKVRA